MSFPRYPKYKASGVEWLGDVPDGWEVKPLRSVFKFSKGLTITKEDLRDEGVCCVNYGEIHSKYGFRLNPDIHPLRCVEPEYLSSNPNALIRDGDFVFADTSEDLEGSGNFTHLSFENPIFAGYHTIIARPQKGICSLLLAYQIYSSVFRSQIQRQVKGVKVFSISQGILKSAKCWLPPLPEQTAIAEFLDRETGKIDELVAEQRQLMELLKEKRQAVISHAVTKGLNPHAPMKPSGIEWLGDVPVGWASGRLRYFTELIVDGTHHSPQSLPGGDYLYITAKNIKEHGFDLSEITYVTELQHREIFTRCPVQKGDVLYIKDGATAGIAMVNPLVEEFSLLSSVALIRTIRTKLIPEFIAYQLNASQFKNPALNGLVGGAMTRFTLELISRFEVSMPPIEEQRAIVAQLDIETAKFDTLTAEAQRAIDLLQERRTALISAAVTGQIDVRQQPRN